MNDSSAIIAIATPNPPPIYPYTGFTSANDDVNFFFDTPDLGTNPSETPAAGGHESRLAVADNGSGTVIGFGANMTRYNVGTTPPILVWDINGQITTGNPGTFTIDPVGGGMIVSGSYRQWINGALAAVNANGQVLGLQNSTSPVAPAPNTLLYNILPDEGPNRFSPYQTNPLYPYSSNPNVPVPYYAYNDPASVPYPVIWVPQTSGGAVTGYTPVTLTMPQAGMSFKGNAGMFFNKNLQIAGGFKGDPNAFTGEDTPFLWQNYQYHNLSDFFPALSAYAKFQVRGLDDNGSLVAVATPFSPANASQQILQLIPVQLSLVNRDVLTQTWSNNQVQSGTVSVYAGTTTGDMVSWKLGCPSAWESGTFTWTATDSQGNVIIGPTGVGVDHWQISNGGNDPASNTTLTWKPDTYTIKCSVALSGGGTFPVQFTQKVGWRTEDYVVIGQIVNTITYQNSGPANSTQSTNFRSAINLDCFVTFDVGNTLFAGLNLSSSNLPDSAFGFIEFGSWGLWSHSLTPLGPLSYSGWVTQGERYWMMENALNASVDTPTIAGPSDPPMTATQMSSVQSNGKYRIFHHYQTRFTLTSAGKIDTTSFYDIHNDGITGQTKFNIPAGTFNPTWNNPVIPLFAVNAQTNPIDSIPNQGHTQTSSDGTKHSSYASGRVGSDGQNVNWHVMGQDVPWIFSEIICQVASNHAVTSNVEMSVNTDWQDSGTVSGTVNFNNLNIYKGAYDSTARQLNYVSQKLLPMEGQLQSFILSVPPGTWPTPPTTPSIQ